MGGSPDVRPPTVTGVIDGMLFVVHDRVNGTHIRLQLPESVPDMKVQASRIDDTATGAEGKIVLLRKLHAAPACTGGTFTASGTAFTTMVPRVDDFSGRLQEIARFALDLTAAAKPGSPDLDADRSPYLDIGIPGQRTGQSVPVQPKPAKRITRYPVRTVLTVIFALITAGGVVLFLHDWIIIGGGLAVLGTFATVCGLLAIVSAYRTRTLRAAYARKIGGTFTQRDSNLTGQLGLRMLDGVISAEEVLGGTFAGQPFFVFDYWSKPNLNRTAIVLLLPEALPLIDSKEGIGTELLADPRIRDYLDTQFKQPFHANRRAIATVNPDFMSPTMRTIEQRLDGLAKLAATLLAARPSGQRTGG
jgi:hypothetical protein